MFRGGNCRRRSIHAVHCESLTFSNTNVTGCCEANLLFRFGLCCGNNIVIVFLSSLIEYETGGCHPDG